MRRRWSITAALMLAALQTPACQDHVFDYTPDLRVRATAVTTAVFNVEPTDVLFVIDNSGSMAEEQDELIRNATAFIEEMSASPNDFRIGVVSTDPVNLPAGPVNDRDLCCMHLQCNTSVGVAPRHNCTRQTDRCIPDGSGGSSGVCMHECSEDRDCMPGESCNLGTGYCQVVVPCSSPFAPTQPMFCDAGNLRSPTGLPFHVADSGSDYDQWFMSRPADSSEAARQALVQQFADTVRSLGVNGSTFEAGLEAMHLALDELSAPHSSGHNRGFPRPGADLAVIFLTDEDDCSRPSDAAYFGDMQTDCYAASGRATLTEAAINYVTFLANLKGNGDYEAGIKKVRAAAILGGVRWDPDMGTSEPLLSFEPRGCYLQRGIGPTEDCGCWVIVDALADPALDLYCQILAGPPYSQRTDRWPPKEVTGGVAGGCLAMPGSRYLEFLEHLSAERVRLGYRSDTLVDSICSDDYQQTLLNIVNSVILNDCFVIDQVPLGGAAGLEVRLNGEVLTPVEAESDQRGWSWYPATSEICLEGGLRKRLNDEFEILVITENTVD